MNEEEEGKRDDVLDGLVVESLGRVQRVVQSAILHVRLQEDVLQRQMLVLLHHLKIDVKMKWLGNNLQLSEESRKLRIEFSSG